MSNIKITDLKETTEVTTVQAENVKGGGVHINFEGIDGEFKDTDHKGGVSLTISKLKS